MDIDLEKYLPLVKSVAKRYASNESELEELIAAGAIGLVEAEESFNKDCGYQFITYAIWFIMRSIEYHVKCKKS